MREPSALAVRRVLNLYPPLLFAGIFRVLASFQVAVPAAQGTEATPQPANTAA